MSLGLAFLQWKNDRLSDTSFAAILRVHGLEREWYAYEHGRIGVDELRAAVRGVGE